MRAHAVVFSLTLAATACGSRWHDDRYDVDYDVDTAVPVTEPTAPRPDEPDPCEADLRACLASGVDPQTCEADFRACHATAPDGGDPSVPTDPTDTATTTPDPLAACDQLLGECLRLDLPLGFCQEEHDDCVARYTPDPCTELYDTCVDLGLDPDYCQTQHDDCAGL
jgi:hypothetical protein